MRAEIRRYSDAEYLAHEVAASILSENARRVVDQARFSLVLAGGTTPRRVYEVLAQRATGFAWRNVHVFWGDERCVAPDHPDSNYAMAKKALLDQVPIPPANVHRIRGELGAAAAADAYEQELRGFFGGAREPSFDLVLLGMGEDGHTASLFSGNAALAPTSRWALPVETEAKAPRWRVSLSLAALSGATTAYFIVTGSGKRAVLADILRDPEAAALRYPAAGVHPRHLVWCVDAAAAPETVSR